MRHIATYAGLIPMAFFGVLIRLGFEALGDCESRDTLMYMIHSTTLQTMVERSTQYFGRKEWGALSWEHRCLSKARSMICEL